MQNFFFTPYMELSKSSPFSSISIHLYSGATSPPPHSLVRFHIYSIFFSIFLDVSIHVYFYLYRYDNLDSVGLHMFAYNVSKHDSSSCKLIRDNPDGYVVPPFTMGVIPPHLNNDGCVILSIILILLTLCLL